MGVALSNVGRTQDRSRPGGWEAKACGPQYLLTAKSQTAGPRWKCQVGLVGPDIAAIRRSTVLISWSVDPPVAFCLLASPRDQPQCGCSHRRRLVPVLVLPLLVLALFQLDIPNRQEMREWM